jgi:hypothetical protein
VISELGEACERTQGVVVVVEDGHLHGETLLWLPVGE